MKIDRRIQAFKYPVRKSLSNSFVELFAYPRMWFSSLSFWIFHVSIVLVLVSWLAMDLPFFLSGLNESILEIGGVLYPIRLFHRYVGAVFVVGYILYGIQLATNRKLKDGLSHFDYFEFAFIGVIVLYGISYTVGSIFKVELIPFTFITITIPFINETYILGSHIFIVYGWFLASILFSGGIMKAIACITLVLIRGISHPTVLRGIDLKDNNSFGNLTRYGVTQLLACGKDGDCVEACPVFDENKSKTSSPRERLLTYRSEVLKKRGPISLILKRENQKKDMKELSSLLYECTLCGRCMSVCPVEFDLVNLWKTARETTFIEGFSPDTVKEVSKQINTHKNLYGLPNDTRDDWIDYESANVPRKEQAETVYFVGCVTSYSGRLGEVARSVSSILNHLGEDWTILGGNEWCCGAPLDFSGATPGLKEIANHNVEAIENMNAKKVIFNCPGCYRVFKEKYPNILGRQLKFQSLHIVEYLNSKLEDVRLKPKNRFTGQVTYHDPCELGRLVGMYDEPRALINKYAERITELPENRSAGRCCGTGGVMKVVVPDLANKVGVTRIRQVKDVKAELLLSACPACLIGLGEAAKIEKLKVRVTDISKLVSDQLGLT
ncbi:(Fe-S)-binding protein [[Eubacterium] cellulosolvens]